MPVPQNRPKNRLYHIFDRFTVPKIYAILVFF